MKKIFSLFLSALVFTGIISCSAFLPEETGAVSFSFVPNSREATVLYNLLGNDSDGKYFGLFLYTDGSYKVTNNEYSHGSLDEIGVVSTGSYTMSSTTATLTESYYYATATATEKTTSTYTATIDISGATFDLTVCNGTLSITFSTDSGSSGSSDYKETYYVKVQLKGDYEETKNIEVENYWESSGATVSFDSVPVNANIYAIVKVFFNNENSLHYMMYGKSSPITVSPGENALSLTLSHDLVYDYYEINIYLENYNAEYDKSSDYSSRGTDITSLDFSQAVYAIQNSLTTGSDSNFEFDEEKSSWISGDDKQICSYYFKRKVDDSYNITGSGTINGDNVNLIVRVYSENYGGDENKQYYTIIPDNDTGSRSSGYLTNTEGNVVFTETWCRSQGNVPPPQEINVDDHLSVGGTINYRSYGGEEFSLTWTGV